MENSIQKPIIVPIIVLEVGSENWGDDINIK